MSTKHTPGPWVAWDDGVTIGIETDDGEPLAIAEALDFGDLVPPGQLAADGFITVKISPGDLQRLDAVITLLRTLACDFNPGMYDDVWNIRQGMVPFQPGDAHFDAEIDV